MLTCYDEISNSAAVSQTQALQLLLDVKYLTMLLVPRDNKVMGSFCQILHKKRFFNLNSDRVCGNSYHG